MKTKLLLSSLLLTAPLLVASCGTNYNIKFFNSENEWNEISKNNKNFTLYIGTSACPFCLAYKDLPENKLSLLEKFLNNQDDSRAKTLLNSYHGEGPLNNFAAHNLTYGFFNTNQPFEQKPFEFPQWVKSDLISQTYNNLDKYITFKNNRWQKDSPLIDHFPITISFSNNVVSKWTVGYYTRSQLNGYKKFNF